jgi:alpha-beta hydrolase superfamily lysophospholipase
MWDGYKHELHTDPERAEVFKTMIQWMESQIRNSDGHHS